MAHGRALSANDPMSHLRPFRNSKDTGKRSSGVINKGVPGSFAGKRPKRSCRPPKPKDRFSGKDRERRRPHPKTRGGPKNSLSVPSVAMTSAPSLLATMLGRPSPAPSSTTTFPRRRPPPAGGPRGAPPPPPAHPLGEDERALPERDARVPAPEPAAAVVHARLVLTRVRAETLGRRGDQRHATIRTPAEVAAPSPAPRSIGSSAWVDFAAAAATPVPARETGARRACARAAPPRASRPRRPCGRTRRGEERLRVERCSSAERSFLRAALAPRV